MNKALKKYGKARFRDTRLGVRDRIRRFLKMAYISGIASVSATQIHAISQSPAKTKEEKLNKKLAMMDETVSAYRAIAAALTRKYNA